MVSTSIDGAIAASKERIISHMNEDHTDSLVAYARHYAKADDVKSAAMVDLTVKGLTLEVCSHSGEKRKEFVPFRRALKHPQDIRAITVEMHHEAYHALGFLYKVQNGYYNSAMIKLKVRDIFKSTNAQAAIVAFGVGAVLLFAQRRGAHKALKSSL
eukprot:TRINITY_DN32668_c0_g1_i2.p1 TRINITY_DN32668_c0_g1~~TRINITY_DN32668_c0_g1_i2.p1  ORF type:complete len:157 (+),score=31.25 TRINITY_DN32668_c0_g1_i2:41-511(+)